MESSNICTYVLAGCAVIGTAAAVWSAVESHRMTEMASKSQKGMANAMKAMGEQMREASLSAPKAETAQA